MGLSVYEYFRWKNDVSDLSFQFSHISLFEEANYFAGRGSEMEATDEK